MKSFMARRNEPVLVAPARATPPETKALSDMDCLGHLRYLQPEIEFFAINPAYSQRPARTARVIMEAVAEALVYYYPLAGRLREVPGGKLAVECTGEGVVFVEAEADVSMEELGNPPLPPYPCVEEFMCDVTDIGDVAGAPLFFMQVTQLRCGGFVIGLHICHTIADGYGANQFLKAIADLARGASDIVLPVWQRDLLTERIPPRINPEFGSFFETPSNDDVFLSTPPEEMIVKYFFFGPRDIAVLRSHAPGHCTTYELLTAVMWRCRTKALSYQLHNRVRLMLDVNARGRWKNHTLIPYGYYGNALFYSVVEATVSDLCGSPLCQTIELVRQAKNIMTDENMEAMVDFIASLRGKPEMEIKRLYEVCDIKWIGQDALDFGWARRISGGIPDIGDDVSSKSASYHMRCTDDKGMNIIVVSLLLPKPAMEKFAREIAVWLNTNVRAGL